MNKKANIYTRSDCPFRFCANPGDCYAADACLGPVKVVTPYTVNDDGTVTVGKWSDDAPRRPE